MQAQVIYLHELRNVCVSARLARVVVQAELLLCRRLVALIPLSVSQDFAVWLSRSLRVRPKEACPPSTCERDRLYDITLKKYCT